MEKYNLPKGWKYEVFDKIENVYYLPNRDFFFLPREIAGFVLSKDNSGNWKIHNNIWR